ncbi:MAG: acyl carrier protein [Ruminococcaceae bacterium]|nr:acyl carrier protein [Oscillospiraceae bacterium]
MTNLEKYNAAFIEGLGIDKSQVNDDLKYQDLPNWDSVGHMGLVSCIEETFEIVMDTDDIIDFSSYKKGKELLAKYNIEL